MLAGPKRVSVLVEAISVIIRVDAIAARGTGGLKRFFAEVPNGTLACDNEIARVGFMATDDARAYVAMLEATGLTFLRGGMACDIAVVDQQRGLTAACEWLNISTDSIGDNKVVACQLAGSTAVELYTPEGWVYEGSLSQTFSFVPSGQVAKSLDHLERRGGLDIYRNRLTGGLGYIGRTIDEQAK